MELPNEIWLEIIKASKDLFFVKRLSMVSKGFQKIYRKFKKLLNCRLVIRKKRAFLVRSSKFDMPQYQTPNATYFLSNGHWYGNDIDGEICTPEHFVKFHGHRLLVPGESLADKMRAAKKDDWYSGCPTLSLSLLWYVDEIKNDLMLLIFDGFDVNKPLSKSMIFDLFYDLYDTYMHWRMLIAYREKDIPMFDIVGFLNRLIAAMMFDQCKLKPEFLFVLC